MSSLLDTLKSNITPELIQNLSGSLGESSGAVHSALADERARDAYRACFESHGHRLPGPDHESDQEHRGERDGGRRERRCHKRGNCGGIGGRSVQQRFASGQFPAEYALRRKHVGDHLENLGR